MISTILSSESISWLIAEIITIFFAMVGGILVFWGLRIEKMAENDLSPDIFSEEEKSRRLKAKRGWKLLMLGVFIEILVAGFFAAKDGWEIREVQINEVRNNPLNQPISDLTATVVLNVDGQPNGWPTPGPHIGTWLELGETNIGYRTVYFGEFQQLYNNDTEAFRHVGILGNPSYTGYILRFRTDRMTFAPSSKETERIVTPKEMLDKIRILLIHVDFIPNNSLIVGDSAEIVINGSIRKSFMIHRQSNDMVSASQNTNDSGIYFYATNSVH